MECAFGPSMSANSGNYNYYSNYSFISFNGFINENYFNIISQEQNLVQNIEMSHAITKNPFNYEKDAFLGLMLKSKYDGIGKREPIDLSIALDISGSMSLTDEQDKKTRLDLAKEALIKLISIMDENNDRLSLITFNEGTQKIFDLLNKTEIQSKFIDTINSIQSEGGTNLVEAVIAAMDNMNINNETNNKKKRIVLITDAYYEDTREELFNLIKYNSKEMHVPCTIIAISSESNITLADKVCHFPGCNYFTVTKSSELEDYLVKNFNYIFFPIAYQTKMTVKSENAKIIKCIGDENNILDELDKNKNNDLYKENNVEFDFGTAFSSELMLYKDKTYSKGGLILLKVNPGDLLKDEDIKFDITLEYIQDDNKAKACQNYSYIIKKEEKANEYFKNNNIKKGIAIYYFVNALNWLVQSKKEKNENKNKQNKEKDVKMLETRQIIAKLLQNNFGNEPDNEENEKILNNYLKLVEERYKGFKTFVVKFYNLDAAPPIF